MKPSSLPSNLALSRATPVRRKIWYSEMTASQSAVGQTYKMQSCVGKGKGLSRNQIPGHTCYSLMSVTLLRSEWPVKIMNFKSLLGNDKVHGPNSIFKSLFLGKLSTILNVFSFSVSSTFTLCSNEITTLTHSEAMKPAQPEWVGTAAPLHTYLLPSCFPFLPLGSSSAQPLTFSTRFCFGRENGEREN